MITTENPKTGYYVMAGIIVKYFPTLEEARDYVEYNVKYRHSEAHWKIMHLVYEAEIVMDINKPTTEVEDASEGPRRWLFPRVEWQAKRMAETLSDMKQSLDTIDPYYVGFEDQHQLEELQEQLETIVSNSGFEKCCHNMAERKGKSNL